jgi:uncharacterized SAM-binding protein YcdF (DUF218 family)
MNETIRQVFAASWRHPLVRPVVLVLAVVLAALLVLRGLGTWLIAADPVPERLDVVCTFAGESYRVNYSKQLVLRFPDAHWLLSDYKNGHSRLLQRSDFDMRRVTVIDTCKNTRSEINALRGWIAAYRASPGAGTRPLDIGLVSSPYHMRRIQIMASRYIGNHHVRIHLLPVPLEHYQWDRNTFRYWWRSNYITSVSLLELVKIGYFMLTGYL